MKIYESISKAINEGKPVAFCTVVETNGSVPRHAGSKMLVYADGSRYGSVGGGEVEERTIKAARESLLDGHPALVDFSLNQSALEPAGLCGGNVKIYIEPILQVVKMIIYGAGHVGKAVAHLAKWLNFRVVVSDDREGSCDSAIIPDADMFLPMAMEVTPHHFEIDSNTYLVLVTRGADVDIKGIPSLLKTDAAYIGVMGSRKRWEFTRKGLLEAGVTEEEISRIKTPIGLDIHAETPEEIAVSILAEIIHWRNHGAA
jgi:xanthine dehydrogenase accessory factor